MGETAAVVRRKREPRTAVARSTSSIGLEPTRDWSVPDGGHIDDEDLATAGASIRSLTVPLAVDGQPDARWQGPEGVQAARAHHAAAITELPPEALRLGEGDPAVPTVYR